MRVGTPRVATPHAPSNIGEPARVRTRWVTLWIQRRHDGCVTATEADKSFSTKRERDDFAFERDKAYAAGWRQGYLQCGGNERQPNDGGRVLGEDNESLR